MTSKLLSISALCVVLAFTATDASARSIHRSGYAVGPHGRGGWSHSDVVREPGSVSGRRSFQAFDGRGGTRTFDRGCSGGMCSYSSNTSTNSGANWSRSGSVGNGQANWNRSGSGPNGGSYAISGACSNAGPGASCSRAATATGPNGNTWSRTGAASRNGDGQANWSRSTTGPNGGNVSRSGNCTEGVGCSRTITKTGPNGNQIERSDWITVE